MWLSYTSPRVLLYHSEYCNLEMEETVNTMLVASILAGDIITLHAIVETPQGTPADLVPQHSDGLCFWMWFSPVRPILESLSPNLNSGTWFWRLSPVTLSACSCDR